MKGGERESVMRQAVKHQCFSMKRVNPDLPFPSSLCICYSRNNGLPTSNKKRDNKDTLVLHLKLTTNPAVSLAYGARMAGIQRFTHTRFVASPKNNENNLWNR